MVHALDEITAALVSELQDRYRSIQIMRNGATQITLFRSDDFMHAQIVVSLNGVYFVIDPTKDVPDTEIPENLRGPYALEDPNMFTYLYTVIDQWHKSHRR